MGKVTEINGPILRALLPGAMNGEQVVIGRMRLMGEVIGREDDEAIVQVYESTESLSPGESIEALGYPLSVELGPGLLGKIFDGVQRPLDQLYEQSGDYISRGLNIPALDRESHWDYRPDEKLAKGDFIQAGQVLGSVQETETIEHRVMLPPGMEGELVSFTDAKKLTVDDTVARIRDKSGVEHEVKLFHRWPVRQPRPYQRRDNAVLPLFTGQRILDTLFPMLKGGKAAVPGPFGAGKTVVQQQIARWSNADIVIYVGCGERGNELVDILDSFPQLDDPHTGRSLMERTLLIANTSNMPVVAREASIYVGVSIAEYYRDQGYDVVMVADSTSRWAEALREVAGRLGQMPVEEGYPAYLASRLASFYERAGRVVNLGGTTGSVSLIGAVSPPGGDFSEPVTSHTKEIVQTFWALSKELADARHYPAVSWTESFSEYVSIAAQWWEEHVDKRWFGDRAEAVSLLSTADELARIVNLVGPEALSPTQRWSLEIAGLMKEAVLQQSALDSKDSYASPEKQFELLHLVVEIKRKGDELLKKGVPVQQLLGMDILSEMRRLKSRFGSDEIESLRGYSETIEKSFSEIANEYSEMEHYG